MSNGLDFFIPNYTYKRIAIEQLCCNSFTNDCNYTTIDIQSKYKFTFIMFLIIGIGVVPIYYKKITPTITTIFFIKYTVINA